MLASISKVVPEITPRNEFLQALNAERKRAERSSRPFLLALINGDCFQESTGLAVATAISAALASRIRETDSVGWCQENYTLGVLFVELGEVDNTKIQLLTEKIFEAIREAVTVDELYRLRISFRVLPSFGQDEGQDDSWEGMLYRQVHDESGIKSDQQAVKRSMDVVGGSILMFLLLPLFVTIAILIKATSEGPIFFRQKRVGCYGKLFDFWKFRTMRVDNDPAIHRQFVMNLIEGREQNEEGKKVFKIVADPRVTPIGRLLRRSSLDELPQFMNVILGDMSLVGPRPPVPYEFDCYRPWHKRRLLETKPGLTGPWQVHGRSRTTFDEMVRMDLRYARTQSLWLDFKLVAQTPVAMFLGRGAY
jgi:lipopolysaccharide/colanic/teichoic acid biosynthesis glycosyltransferase